MTGSGMGFVLCGEGEGTGAARGGRMLALCLALAVLAPSGRAEEVPAEGGTACVDVPSRAAEVQIGMTKDEVAAILGPPLTRVEKMMLDGASREEAEERAARIDPDSAADMDTHRYMENCEPRYIWILYLTSTPQSRDYRVGRVEDGKLGIFVMFSEPLDGPPEDE